MRAQTERLDAGAGAARRRGSAPRWWCSSLYGFCARRFRRFRPTRKDGLLLGPAAAWPCWASCSSGSPSPTRCSDRYAALPVEALYYAIPVAAGAMLVRFVLAQELALFFALVFACLAGVMLGNSLRLRHLRAGGLAGRRADRIDRAQGPRGHLPGRPAHRRRPTSAAVLCLRAGGGQGLGSRTRLLTRAVRASGRRVPGGAGAGDGAARPLVESVLRLRSDIKLLELANLNHPALKELIVQAPGTYHHSIIMGTLVESAAEAIGANPLLARGRARTTTTSARAGTRSTSARTRRARTGTTRSRPAMSAVIIKRHVHRGHGDGAPVQAAASWWRTPSPSTTARGSVGYFFHKALKEQEGKEGAAARWTRASTATRAPSRSSGRPRW